MPNQYTSEWFTKHNDPGHGWIKVAGLDLARLGLDPARDFSAYSYWNRDKAGDLYFYLEEDCDAGIFLAAYYGKHRAMPLLAEKHSNNDSIIRRYNRLPEGDRYRANMAQARAVWREIQAA